MVDTVKLKALRHLDDDGEKSGMEVGVRKVRLKLAKMKIFWPLVAAGLLFGTIWVEAQDQTGLRNWPKSPDWVKDVLKPYTPKVKEEHLSLRPLLGSRLPL